LMLDNKGLLESVLFIIGLGQHSLMFSMITYYSLFLFYLAFSSYLSAILDKWQLF
jgi:hypothetical protein